VSTGELQMNSRNTKRGWALVVGLVGLLVGCADDGGDTAATTSVPPMPALQSPLVADGLQVCTDEEGDPTISAEVQAAPPIEQPGVDLLEGRATLTDDAVTATFSLVGAPDPEADPTFIMLVGEFSDTTGFELAIDHQDGLWIPELTVHTQGYNQGVPLPDATVEADGASLTVSVPVRALPLIRANHLVSFGAKGTLRDAEGNYLDNRGEPVESVEDAASVLDDCYGAGG
jgi:hypothetical protein